MKTFTFHRGPTLVLNRVCAVSQLEQLEELDSKGYAVDRWSYTTFVAGMSEPIRSFGTYAALGEERDRLINELRGE